jgi:hypothetical protein
MIRPGDLVRLAGDVPLTGEVLRTSREGMTRGHLQVRPVCGDYRRLWGTAGRDVLVRDVEAHWRRVRLRAAA